jgi:hypothetical protein
VTVLLVDSHLDHAPVAKLMASLIPCDLLYYSDTRSGPFEELSGITRVAKLLSMLSVHARGGVSTAVLLGRGMSLGPREAVEIGARNANIELIYAADLLAEHACGILRPGDLCTIGESCLTMEDVRAHLGRHEVREIRSCRITPMYTADDPLKPIVKNWGASIGGYVLATSENKRIADLLRLLDADIPILDEHEHLAFALAERVPESKSPSLRACVTELGPGIAKSVKRLLGVAENAVLEIGAMEPAPATGPFAMSLDADGTPG